MHRSRNVCDHFVAQILPFFGDTFLPKSLSGYIGTRNNWSILAKATAAQGTDSRASTHCPTGGGAVVPSSRMGTSRKVPDTGINPGREPGMGSSRPSAPGGAGPQPPRGPRPLEAPPPPLIGGERGGRARHWPLGQRSRAPLAAGGCHSGRRRPGEVVRQPGPSSAGGGGGTTGTMVSSAGRPHCPGPGRVRSARRRARGGREGAESTWEAGSRAPALCFEGR